jgi:hypothetical protein
MFRMHTLQLYGRTIHVCNHLCFEYSLSLTALRRGIDPNHYPTTQLQDGSWSYLPSIFLSFYWVRGPSRASSIRLSSWVYWQIFVRYGLATSIRNAPSLGSMCDVASKQSEPIQSRNVSSCIAALPRLGLALFSRSMSRNFTAHHTRRRGTQGVGRQRIMECIVPLPYFRGDYNYTYKLTS